MESRKRRISRCAAVSPANRGRRACASTASPGPGEDRFRPRAVGRRGAAEDAAAPPRRCRRIGEPDEIAGAVAYLGLGCVEFHDRTDHRGRRRRDHGGGVVSPVPSTRNSCLGRGEHKLVFYVGCASSRSSVTAVYIGHRPSEQPTAIISLGGEGATAHWSPTASLTFVAPIRLPSRNRSQTAGKTSYVLRTGHRSGHHVLARHRVRADLRSRRRAAGISADFPASGWVEHDPEDIWNAMVATCARGAEEAESPPGHRRHRHHQPARDHGDLGSQNRGGRSTAPSSGRTVAPPRSARRLATTDTSRLVTAQDRPAASIPIFPAPRSPGYWITCPARAKRAKRGELAFGTVDCYLLWRLTGGKVHATDATNASRTLLFNIHTGDWDDELLKLFGVPRAMLPEVQGMPRTISARPMPDLFGAAIPIRGIAGDQQAATMGQACFAPGMIKSTYGTGCFALLNTGDQPIASQEQAADDHRLSTRGQAHLCAGRSIFVAGAAVQWLRDGLHLIVKRRRKRPARRKLPIPRRRSIWCRPLSASARPGGIARCARRVVRAHPQHRPRRNRPCRAGSVCYQTLDLWTRCAPTGRGETANTCCASMAAWSPDWTMQRLADLARAVLGGSSALGCTCSKNSVDKFPIRSIIVK